MYSHHNDSVHISVLMLNHCQLQTELGEAARTHPADTLHLPQSPFKAHCHASIHLPLKLESHPSYLTSLLLVIAAPSNLSSLQRTFMFFRSINKLLNWGHIMSLQNIWLYVMIVGNSLVIAGTALKLHLEFRCVRMIHMYNMYLLNEYYV